MAVDPRDVPLKILIADADDFASTLLEHGLKRERPVLDVIVVQSLKEAEDRIASFGPNVIFIDPLNLELERASDFIFRIRKESPGITFVLFVDIDQAEERRADFYNGERHRFSHYFKLDKRTPTSAFGEELSAVVAACQQDSALRMSDENLNRLLETAKRLAVSTGDTASGSRLIHEVGELLKASKEREKKSFDFGRMPSVFVSYRFAEDDYISGLTQLLEQSGFAVVTGKSTNTFVSLAVLDRIRSCDLFVCLITRDKEKVDGTFTTSPWLLEEKGAALALRKPIVLMIEEGVSDFGGLQGDWQRIHFGPKGFLSAALQAVRQLSSYSGKGGADAAGAASTV